jgi:glycosyltransferase involved in cell wall biosynthesis
MRLLYLSADPGVPVLGRKGASVHVREMACALEAGGASVVIASPRVAPEGETLQGSVKRIGIDPVLPKEHRTLEELDAAIERQSAEIVELATGSGFNAVYERFSLFSRGGVDAARLLGAPHALEVNAPLREEARRFRSLPHEDRAAEIEVAVFAATDRIYAVSSELAELLVRQGVPRSKIDVLPNGVDRTKFTHRERPDGERFTVGFAGNLKPWQGIGVLVEAFQLALVREPSLRLEIVGAGPEEVLLESLDVPADSFRFHGSLPHRRTLELMATWDAGVAPYLPVPDFYFSSLKVLEYMASGICPVASDLGQIRTLLGGDRGVLVPPGDVPALAQALVGLARNRRHAEALGARARTYAHRFRTWSSNADRVLRGLRAARQELVA